MPDQSPTNDPMAAFGPNEWLVDELYQQYLQDKNSVDKAWWEFFEDYRPGESGANGGANGAAPAATTTAPARQEGAASAPATVQKQARHHRQARRSLRQGRGRQARGQGGRHGR